MVVFVELIRVQSSSIASFQTSALLWAAILAELESSRQCRHHLFFHQDHVDEALLMIWWDVADMDHQGSMIARSLAAELGRHGLVHHSVWREEAAPPRSSGR